MSGRKANKANAVFKKKKPGLRPLELRAQETARKSDRLKALRLARDAELAAGDVTKPDGSAGDA